MMPTGMRSPHSPAVCQAAAKSAGSYPLFFVNPIDALGVPVVRVDLVEGDAGLEHVDQGVAPVPDALGDQRRQVLGLAGKAAGDKGGPRRPEPPAAGLTGQLHHAVAERCWS